MKPTTYNLIINKSHERKLDKLLQKEKIEFDKSKGIANSPSHRNDGEANPKDERYIIYTLFNTNASSIFHLGLEIGQDERGGETPIQEIGLQSKTVGGDGKSESRQ